MAKRGGFPGGGIPGNMNNLMKQAQKMQRQMEENQKALDEICFSRELSPMLLFGQNTLKVKEYLRAAAINSGNANACAPKGR